MHLHVINKTRILKRLPCMSSTSISLREYSYVQWENASSVSSNEQQGAISSPVLLLYFLKLPIKFLSIVNHWPLECQSTRRTSRNLVEREQGQFMQAHALTGGIQRTHKHTPW